MNEFTFRLILLFFPGIISALLVEKLATTERWSDFRFALYSLVLGLSSYLLYALGVTATERKWPPEVHLLEALGNNSAVPYEEIFIVTIIAASLSFGAAFLLNRHYLTNFARLLRVSERFGDRDVWSHTFNSSDVNNEWVVVRDFERDLAFEGWVNAFAETADPNELLLTEVKVYRSSDSVFLYEIDALYLTRKKDDLTIEFRKS